MIGQGMQGCRHRYRSDYLLPTSRENPAEAQIISHRLMLRAGLIRQSTAGIYIWLPLGLRVLNHIAAIVRQEQDRIGGQEMLLSTIQPAELWQKSGRLHSYGPEMLMIKDRRERMMLYGPTNEEQVTDLLAGFDLPASDVTGYCYQLQWKFRDEIRPRFGVMRGREFYMKDGYSFDRTKAAAIACYQRIFLSYLRTFARMSLTPVPMRAESGQIGGDYSHEFIVLAATGESQVYCDRAILSLDPHAPVESGAEADRVKTWLSYYSATEDKHDPALFAQVAESRRYEGRGIEVGHTFYFGQKYSKVFKAHPRDCPDQLYEMGSYGIGISRLVGALIEVHHDQAGIVWPLSVAPFKVGVVLLQADRLAVRVQAERLLTALSRAGIEALVDDRNLSAGVMFTDLDLIGLPYRLVVSPRLESEVEWRCRRSGETGQGSIDAVIKAVTTAIAQRLQAPSIATKFGS